MNYTLENDKENRFFLKHEIELTLFLWKKQVPNTGAATLLTGKHGTAQGKSWV